jgi:hypothetical protein
VNDYCGQRKAEARTAAFCKIVKNKLISVIFTAALLSLAEAAYAQAFTNLNFESANIPASTQPSFIPISQGLPGWNAYFISSAATNQAPQAVYDGIPLSGNAISIVDANVGFGFNPIQGSYSAFLCGGVGDAGLSAAQISQSGLVPGSTKSIQFEAQTYGYPFIVTLGDQLIDLSPLQVFPNYTLYGGNIPSSLAGHVATLSITEQAPQFPLATRLELDNIVFSPSSIPEPGTLALAALGALFLGICRRRR